MKIWLVSIFEMTPWDENQNTRFNSMAHIAVERGHEVTFWSSTFKHTERKQRFEKTKRILIRDGLKVNFVKAKPYKESISLSRLRSHQKYAEDVVREMECEKELPDIIFMAYPPVSSVYNISKWAKEKKIPVIVDIIDLWPDTFRKKMKGIPWKVRDWLIKPYRKKAEYIFNQADAVSGLSNDRIEWARTYNPDLKNYHAFYPAVLLDDMRKQLKDIKDTYGEEKDKKFRVIYAGSLESSYDIPAILGAAKILQEKYPNDIEFVIAGNGQQKDAVKRYEEENNNLRYVGRIPKGELMKEYCYSDLGLIQHPANVTQTVTYKLFDLLACGLPVMNSLKSELNDILLDNEVGLFNEPGDSLKLAENIETCFKNPDLYQEMSTRAIEVTKVLGDSKTVYARAVDLMESRAVEKEQIAEF